MPGSKCQTWSLNLSSVDFDSLNLPFRTEINAPPSYIFCLPTALMTFGTTWARLLRQKSLIVCSAIYCNCETWIWNLSVVDLSFLKLPLKTKINAPPCLMFVFQTAVITFFTTWTNLLLQKISNFVLLYHSMMLEKIGKFHIPTWCFALTLFFLQTERALWQSNTINGHFL
jgi:hypothetical protein